MFFHRFNAVVIRRGGKMGHRLTQKIYTCDKCGKTPEDGEYMWHMGNETWCEKCANNDKEEEDV